MLINEIKELIQSLDQSSVRYFEMEQSDLKLKISKDSNSNIKLTENQVQSTVQNNDEVAVPVETAKETLESSNDVIVNSPMVGAFYASSSPESEPFIKVGTCVEEGQVLCIIEAMKIMNEIESDLKGEVVEIFVQNEDVVEYGQPLLKIRRS